jgi:hypothetical protein
MACPRTAPEPPVEVTVEPRPSGTAPPALPRLVLVPVSASRERPRDDEASDYGWRRRGSVRERSVDARRSSAPLPQRAFPAPDSLDS